MKKTNANVGVPAKKSKNNCILLIIVCILLAVALVLGAILLTATLVRRSRYVVMYEGYGMDEKTVNYFASVYKYKYMITLSQLGVSATDTDAFWAKKPEGAIKTYGDLLSEGAELYIKKMLVANVLFSQSTSLSDAALADIEDTVKMKLDMYGIDGDVGKFNEAVAKYGFDYDTFVKAAKIEYKAKATAHLLYGSAGENVSSATAEEFLQTYSHVKIIFVNSTKRQVLNDKGELVSVRDLTDAERAEQSALVGELRSAISDGSVSPQMFDNMMALCNYITGISKDGEYYLSPSSSFAADFASEGFDEVVKEALLMEKGEYSELDYMDGVCFIYKYNVESGAYDDDGLSAYFEDFYTDAAEYAYDELLKSYAVDAVAKDRFYEIDFVSIPKNYLYRTEF